MAGAKGERGHRHAKNCAAGLGFDHDGCTHPRLKRLGGIFYGEDRAKVFRSLGPVQRPAANDFGLENPAGIGRNGKVCDLAGFEAGYLRFRHRDNEVELLDPDLEERSSR